MFDELESETRSSPTSSAATGASAPQPTDPGSSKSQSFEEFKKQHLSEYNTYKQELLKEFETFKTIQAEEQKKYESNIVKVWDTPQVSSKKVWVEYSQDMHERKSVDFEKGTVSIATTVTGKEGPTDAELRASVTALLEKNKAQAFRDDKVASAVEERTKKELNPAMVETAAIKPEPILIPYITGTETESPEVVDYIVNSMMEHRKTAVSTNKKGVKVVTTVLPMEVDLKKLAAIDPDAVATIEASKPKQTSDSSAGKTTDKRAPLPTAAQPYSGHVYSYSDGASLDPNLVFAIMETESAFNPMAKSGVPAYGLMQIVPRSAGQDATEKLFGKPKILSPSYLYDSENNIEIGTTYLNILYYRYLKGIEDPLSRLYCSIAAYNTGAGNVAKAFTGKRRIKPALTIINGMTPEQVYGHLRKNLPYEETQHYLVKVNDRIHKYKG
jgi:membrane-bound lytic murein transglycosylase C